MKIMRFPIGGIVVPSIAFVLIATMQEKSQKSEKASDTKAVTGGLQKGDQANEYSITELRRAGFVPQTPGAFASEPSRLLLHNQAAKQITSAENLLNPTLLDGLPHQPVHCATVSSIDNRSTKNRFGWLLLGDELPRG